jgi:hypothetical protein
MHAKKIAMLRYKSTGAPRCSAIALRATRARAPVVSTRPPTEQKIHTGKKEPKMLYSGAWEQPTNTSGATRDKPARGRSEVIRRRSRSVDSVFISGRPHMRRISLLIVLTTSSIRPERTSFPTVNPDPRITRARFGRGDEATSGHACPGHWAITGQPQSYVSIKPQS